VRERKGRSGEGAVSQSHGDGEGPQLRMGRLENTLFNMWHPWYRPCADRQVHLGVDGKGHS
jgi:hypothetical protein